MTYLTGFIWPRNIEKWREVVSLVMNIWIPSNADNFLISLETVSLSKILLHGDIC
jgi:hypothetical protein